MSEPRPFATDLPPRAAALAAVQAARDIDVLVVGGGINGAGTFRDLALQGVSVLVVDRVDWGAGASMASSRMAHGGLRYLENGEFRLTAEATRERNRLLRAAGHMIRPLPMAIPFFSHGAGLLTSAKRAIGLSASLRERGFVMAEIGLLLYDWFGRLDRSMPLHRAMLSRGVRRIFPALHPAVRAASIYYDAVIDAPERIAVELIGEGLAASPRGMALNRCALVAVEGSGVVLRDEISGQRFTLRPKVVVNATGAWIDLANRALGVDRPLMGGTKGSHIVIDHPGLLEALAGHGMIFDDGAGRVCILYPIRGKVLLGATDIPVEDPDLADCSDEEEAYLLAATRVVFPKIAFGREHVVFRFCGVRPLPKSNAATPGAVSRDHAIAAFEPEGGRAFPVLNLIGGKWTTFRAFSAQACGAVMARLGAARRVDTANLAVGGGQGMAEAPARQALARSLADRHGLSPERSEALVNRYGAGAQAVAAFLAEEADAPLAGAPTYSEREIRRLARCEMATSVEDVIFRRTTLAMDGRLSTPLLERISAILCEEAGGDPAAGLRDLARLVDRLRARHAVPGLRDCSSPPSHLKTVEQRP